MMNGPRCPRKCGNNLTIHDGALTDPRTAPWLCRYCRYGFWAAELTPEALKAYRPVYHDWGYAMGRLIRVAVAAEVNAALERGSSVSDELRPYLSEAQLALVKP